MFEELKYIYIHKDKVLVDALILNEKFDNNKINKSIKKVKELYGFDFNERNINVENAEKTIRLEFIYDNNTHYIYLGYNSNKKIKKLVKKSNLLFNLHYIDDFDANLFVHSKTKEIHNLKCPSIQACFSFWETEINFNDIMFLDDLEFYGAYFLKNVNFHKCEFKGNLYCRYTKFLKKINFYCSIFSEIAIFDSFTFYDMSFEKVIFKDKIVFSNVNKLLSQKEKIRVNLNIFDSEFDHLDIAFDNNLIKSLTNLERNLKQKTEKREAYKIIASEFQLLNKVYSNRNCYTEEDESFLLYRKYRMRAYSFSIKKCIEYAYYIIGGCGTKLSWIIISCILVIFLFIFIYLIFYSEVMGFNECSVNESIVLSLQSFFSLSYIMANKKMTALLFPIICIESIIGQVLIIYFTICFSRKASR